MKNYISSLHSTLEVLNDEWGGDITWIKPIPKKELENFEFLINWKFPEIFRYFYTQEANGIIIDNKRIYSVHDKEQKKTWVDNLVRVNNPNTSPWFKSVPDIFNDYLIIGNDGGIVFCLSKKYDLPNPSIYICTNTNSTNGVELRILYLDLEALILEMVKQAF